MTATPTVEEVLAGLQADRGVASEWVDESTDIIR
jgi:hypothetical protein